MIAAMGTLVFLATLWLLVVVGVAILEESGAKIADALKGKVAYQPTIVPVRVRARPRFTSPARVQALWRAAA